MNKLENIPKKSLDIDRVKAIELIKLIKIYLASIFALILRLIQRLQAVYSKRIFCFFLNNLFLNLNIL
jgi:hypothetical protein